MPKNVKPSGILVGAIDEGTSSARFLVFDVIHREVVTSHQIEINKFYPQEGWVEQDPKEILDAVVTCIEETMKKLKDMGIDKEDIKTIGVTNQRETTILWDKITGEPLYNAIVWLDMRTTSTMEFLLDTVHYRTRNKNYLKPLCGLPLSPYFSALKIRWLMDNVPRVKQAIEEDRCVFGTVDTWIIWNLTKDRLHITDVSNASRTMLMNIESLKWDPALCSFFGIPQGILPKIHSSSEVYGYISYPEVLSGISITCAVGDQQGALMGQLCMKPGQAKATYGTGCFLLYNTGNKRIDSTQGLVTTVGYKIGSLPAVYALEGSVAVAGAALSWLRDNIELLSNIKHSQSLAERVRCSGDVYFVPAFSGLYAPYWQQDARGVICGITEETQQYHIIRAALEAVCFQTRDILEAMVKDSGTTLTALQVDGGMTVNDLLMQLQSDLTGITVVRPDMVETTAFGAALLAAIGAGLMDVNHVTADQVTTFVPQIGNEERDRRYSKWKMAVERSLNWDTLSNQLDEN
ncbi:glycerol kinase [Orussus abietinus]|uniref:glycerol kinase n=1 Tax=Orussus abietinus TaxID=222816 RepID=UPI0006250468|nr:glycerol kinase [Orussus abietinus]